ncbi:MAG: cyclic nucleotide-binding domain-containing protein [Bacteroidota bacterium]
MIGFNDILGHFSNLLYAAGFTIKNMLWLRVAIIAGCLVEIIYRLNVTESALWTDVPWCTLYIILNAIQIVILLRNRSMMDFTEDEKKFYKATFSNFSPGDYRKLVRSAERKVFKKDEILIQENTKINHLIFILNGLAAVESHGKFIANVRSGSFVGEMSFLTEKPTSADVKAAETTECLVWQKSVLKELMSKSEEIESGLRIVFNTDLITKLAASPQ